VPAAADRDTVGLLERAGEGVLFLDDIHLLATNAYKGLLGALKALEDLRKRGITAVQFRARLVTTSVPLDELERQGQMPDEFYSRIAGGTIVIPPLAQRPHDIEPLMNHFLSNQLSSVASGPREFHDSVVRAFQSYTWPGDVSQLENIVGEIATQVSTEMVTLEDLQGLNLKYKSHRIEWEPAAESSKDSDFLLNRVNWEDGWDAITGVNSEEVKAWLCDLFALDSDVIRDLFTSIEGRADPRPVDCFKALLYFGLVDGNRAQQSEVMKVLGLPWDPTYRLLSFLAGADGGTQGLKPVPLIRGWEGSRWVYVLGPGLMSALRN
jgi:sigma54-dependent transcription regulator